MVMYDEMRCAHGRVIHVAGPDNPCNLCEYEGWMAAREEVEK